MLTLGREMGLSVADITRGSGYDFDPMVVDKILTLARYNSNRLAHTAGAPLHVSRTRYRDPSESGVELLSSALRAAENSDFERAHALAGQAGQIFELTGRKDLLCEVQIAASRISSMERSSLVREARMRAEVDATLDEAERLARALSIEGSKGLLRKAAVLTAVDNFPRRDSLQRRFNGVAAALEAAELVIKGDDQLALAWDCVQRDELSEAQRYLDEAQLAYESTDLRTQELLAVSSALARKRADELRIRTQFRGLVGQAREAIRAEGFVEAALLIEQARDALSQWTNPEGKDLILVTKLTSMVAKTFQNKPLFEAYCAFDDKNLSGQGNRALMMDFNEFLHLLQDLGVLEQRSHKQQSKVSVLKSVGASPSRRRIQIEIEERQTEALSKSRAFQIELCQHCTYPEIKESPQCKVAKADIYDIFRAVNFRSVLQLHRGNIDADNDMSSLNYLEYHLCMLRLGKLLGVPVTDHGTSPLFLKDLRDLEDLKEFFVEAKLKVRERLLSNGENFVGMAKNSMQECAFGDARNQLQLAVAQYQRVDDEQIMRHYLQNCKRLSELIDREEKKEMARKSELVIQAEAALERVKAYLDEFDQTGCRFDESKFKLCVSEAVNARKCYKSAQLYGIYQRDNIQKLQSRIVRSEAHILELRAALAQAHLDLQAAEQLMEAYNFADNDALSSVSEIRFSRSPSFSPHKDPSEEVFRGILTHLEDADRAVTLAKDPSTRTSHELLFRRYISFSRNWVQIHSQSGLSHLEQARKSFESALAARNHDWKSAFEYLHEAKKEIDLAQKFIQKAMLAQCAAPYLDVEDSDIFHYDLLIAMSLKVSETKTSWDLERIDQCAEGIKCLDECKSYMDVGDFTLAGQALNAARTILKGDNFKAITAMQNELECKQVEDESWTKVLMSKASKHLKQATTAISLCSAESAYNECELGLDIMSQVRSISQKPKAFNLRQEIMMSRLNILEGACFTFDSTLQVCSKKLDEVIGLMHELQYEKAENLMSQVRVEINKLETGGVLRIPGAGSKRIIDFDHIQDRFELLNEMLKERDRVLALVADFENQLGESMVLDVARCMEGAKRYAQELSCQELQFQAQRFESGRRFWVKSDEFLLEAIQNQLVSHQSAEELRKTEIVSFVQTQAAEIRKMVLNGDYFEAQMLVSQLHYSYRPIEFLLAEGLEDLVFLKSLEYLERFGLELLHSLTASLKYLACNDFRKSILSITTLKGALANSKMEQTAFVLSSYADVAVCNSFSFTAVLLSKIEKQLKSHIEAEEEIIHIISSEVDKEVEEAHVLIQNLDFDCADVCISRAFSMLSCHQHTLEVLRTVTVEQTRVEKSRSLLSQARNRCNDEVIALQRFDADTGRSLLHKCCVSGDVDRLKELIRLKPDINRKDLLGMSALHCAALNGHEDCLMILIQANATVDLQDLNGCTPLLLAIGSGCTSSARNLLQCGAARTLSDNSGCQALHHCALKDRSDLIEEVLWGDISLDSRVHCERNKHLLEHREGQGYTALMLALIHGNVKSGLALLSSGANPRSKDSHGLNALHLAAKCGFVDFIPLLYSYLKEIDCPGGVSGASALMIACEYGKVGAVRMILDCRGDPNYRDDDFTTPLHHACSYASTDIAIRMLQLLLESGGEIDHRNKSGLSPVGAACLRDEIELFDVLAKTKPTSFTSSQNLQEAFLVSLFSGKYAILNYLFQNFQSDLLMTTISGWNILHMSILAGDSFSVSAILEMSSFGTSMCLAPMTCPNLFFTGGTFQEGDDPLVLAQKCIRLAENCKINRSAEQYCKIYDMLRTYIDRNLEQGTYFDRNPLLAVIDPGCPQIILEQCLYKAIQCTTFKHGSLEHDGATLGSSESIYARSITQDIEFEKQTLLQNITEAEAHELEQVNARGFQLRYELYCAVQSCLKGDSYEAFCFFETASSLVSEDIYERSLLEKTRDRIHFNLIQSKLQTIKLKEPEHFEAGMYDVNSGDIDLSFLGDCWNILDTNGNDAWRSLATNDVIKGECRIWLDDLIEKLESTHQNLTRSKSLDDWKLYLENISHNISSLCQHLCSSIDEDSSREDFDLDKRISLAKHDILNLEKVLNDDQIDGDLEYLITMRNEREMLAIDCFILEEISNIKLYLSSAFRTNKGSQNWLHLRWAKYVFDNCCTKVNDILSDLRSLFADQFIASEIDQHFNVMNLNWISGNEVVQLIDCVPVESNAGRVLSALCRLLLSSRRNIESFESNLTNMEIKQTMDVVIDSVGMEVRRIDWRKLQEEILGSIEMFEKAFRESDYGSCESILKMGINSIMSSLSESHICYLHRFVVSQSHVHVMKTFQENAEISLCGAENNLTCALNLIIDEQLGIGDKQLQNCLLSLEESFKVSCKLLRRNRDETMKTQTRISNFKERLQELNFQLIRREVVCQMVSVVFQVQNDEVLRFEAACLEHTLLDAETNFRNQDFLLCKQQLEAANENVKHSSLKSKIESLDVFQKLQNLYAQASSALEEHSHHQASESYLNKAKEFLEESLHDDAAEMLLQSFQNYQLSANHFSQAHYLDVYTLLLYDVVLHLFEDWISEVCAVAVSTIEDEITKLTLQLAKAVCCLYSGVLFGNKQNDDLTQGLLERVDNVRHLADLVPSMDNVHSKLLTLAQAADHVQSCMRVSILLEKAVSLLSDVSCRDELQESKALVSVLNEEINQAKYNKPDQADIQYPVSCRYHVHEFSDVLDTCTKAIATVEISLLAAEQAWLSRWSDAEQAVQNADYVTCLDSLRECDKLMPVMQRECRQELLLKVENLRMKAKYFHDVSLLKQKSDETSCQIESFLKNKEFDKARKCVDRLAFQKLQLAELHKLGQEQGYIDRS